MVGFPTFNVLCVVSFVFFLLDVTSYRNLESSNVVKHCFEKLVRIVDLPLNWRFGSKDFPEPDIFHPMTYLERHCLRHRMTGKSEKASASSFAFGARHTDHDGGVDLHRWFRPIGALTGSTLCPVDFSAQYVLGQSRNYWEKRQHWHRYHHERPFHCCGISTTTTGTIRTAEASDVVEKDINDRAGIGSFDRDHGKFIPGVEL